jgi:hypothetical protein
MGEGVCIFACHVKRIGTIASPGWEGEKRKEQKAKQKKKKKAMQALILSPYQVGR